MCLLKDEGKTYEIVLGSTGSPCTLVPQQDAPKSKINFPDGFMQQTVEKRE